MSQNNSSTLAMRFLFLLTFVLLLSACGQKGPLFLPESTEHLAETEQEDPQSTKKER